MPPAMPATRRPRSGASPGVHRAWWRTSRPGGSGTPGARWWAGSRVRCRRSRERQQAAPSGPVAETTQLVEKRNAGGQQRLQTTRNGARPRGRFGRYHAGVTSRDAGTSGRTPADPLGKGRHPQPRRLRSRLRFWPVAIRSASVLTFDSPRSRNRTKSCHCLASAKSGSTQTRRFRNACWYRAVAW